MKLYGEHATGISEPVFIREGSTEDEQRAIIDIDNDGDYLADLRNLKEVDLKANVYCDEPEIEGEGGTANIIIELENDSSNLCFFTELKCNDYNEDVRVLYGDNYFSVMPEQIVRIPVRIRNTVAFEGKKTITFSVGGWNAKVKEIGKVNVEFISNQPSEPKEL